VGTTTSNGRVTEDRVFYQRLVVYQIRGRWVGYPERVMGRRFILTFYIYQSIIDM